MKGRALKNARRSTDLSSKSSLTRISVQLRSSRKSLRARKSRNDRKSVIERWPNRQQSWKLSSPYSVKWKDAKPPMRQNALRN